MYVIYILVEPTKLQISKDTWSYMSVLTYARFSDPFVKSDQQQR